MCRAAAAMAGSAPRQPRTVGVLTYEVLVGFTVVSRRKHGGDFGVDVASCGGGEGHQVLTGAERSRFGHGAQEEQGLGQLAASPMASLMTMAQRYLATVR